jgi:hypothetical protein
MRYLTMASGINQTPTRATSSALQRLQVLYQISESEQIIHNPGLSKRSDTVTRVQKLLPLETASDIEDHYRARSGKIEHEYNMRQTFGRGIEETALDKRLSKVLRDNQDRPIQDGDKFPLLTLSAVSAPPRTATRSARRRRHGMRAGGRRG